MASPGYTSCITLSPTLSSAPCRPASAVRHLNGIKTDCRLVNLAFGTLSDNGQDSLRLGLVNFAKGDEHCRAKLTEVKVRDIRRRWATGTVTQALLAASTALIR